MASLISVIIPVYNGASCLRGSVSSVYAQDYGNIELILIDDGSTDDSPAVIEELSKSAPPNVKVVVRHQANGGICAARNSGLDIATGNYIAFVDQDDYIKPDYLSKLASAAVGIRGSGDDLSGEAIASEAGVNSSSGPVVVSGEGTPVEEVIGGCLVSRGSKMQSRNLKPDAPWSAYRNTAPWARLYLRDVIERHHIRFMITGISEDFYFNFVYMSYISKVKIIEQSGYVWNISEESESHSKMSVPDETRDVFAMLDTLIEDMNPEYQKGFMSRRLFSYLLIKHVVWYLLFVAPNADKEQIHRLCKKAAEWLDKNCPEYKDRDFIKINEPDGESFSIRFTVYVSVSMMRKGRFEAFLNARSKKKTGNTERPGT